MSDKDINKMNFKELRAEVQLLRDELAKMKRSYDDILYNLDDDNFSGKFIKEKDNMKASIKISEERIKTMVSKSVKLGDAIPIDTLKEAEDTKEIYVIQTFEDGTDVVIGETYYYYNTITKNWEVLSGESIYTVFEQTEHGFNLRGNVLIDGSLIASGTISAERIETENLSCTRMYAVGFPNGYNARLNGQWGDFGIFSPSASDNSDAASPDCMFGIYHPDGSDDISIRSFGYPILSHDGSSHTTYAKNNWNFSECSGIEWGNNAPVAKFG